MTPEFKMLVVRTVAACCQVVLTSVIALRVFHVI